MELNVIVLKEEICELGSYVVMFCKWILYLGVGNPVKVGILDDRLITPLVPFLD